MAVVVLHLAGVTAVFGGVPGVKGDYTVVVSQKTQADPAWAKVTEALHNKYSASLITYGTNIAETLPDLRRQFPRYVCFVSTPTECTRLFVAEVHRLTRRLDDDPYTDCFWGILTGYDATNALRIAQQREPLTIRKVAAGTELPMDRVEEGMWFSELESGKQVKKEKDKTAAELKGPVDSTQALVDVLNRYQADLFVASGHATERDWMIGFRYKNGFFKHANGQLFGLDTKDRRWPIQSPNPKVYLPVGNCLMGHIDQPDCMALAWMNSAGVHQMLGYTLPTWFGYMGWGVLDYFVEQPGRYTFNEAFLANHHALTYRLATYFPELLGATADPNGRLTVRPTVTEQARADGLTANDARGLVFDRDVVAFYGDPAWFARMANRPKSFEQTLTETNGTFTFEIVPQQGPDSFQQVNRNGSQRGGRPFIAFLPHRVRDVKVIAGQELHPLITDDFILVPNPRTCDPTRRYQVVFQSRVLAAAAKMDAAPVPGETTYYVDSKAGRNSNPGKSPELPWQDFSNINGRTLGPGDRLLIKRGSVINQELRVSARGTADHWAEIGAYGTGARPVIRRNWHIGDRCALIQDPDYLRIRGLAVSHAGKGLVVYYATPGHAGLLIEDCVAHHIEGIYREWTQCSGIPEWRDYEVPGDDGFRASAGIAVTGRGRDITIRDCDLFQISWAFWVAGENLTIDRVYCHACYAYNTSPHPALLSPKNSTLQNCIFDASGYHAFAGTMGIMLGDPRNLTIRNCTFRNQPDSGSHDEGAIDFENNGDGCLIDNCTFENNAGAAIEVLGLSSPQPKNVEIRHSRFIKNNWAKKLGPSEIFIWGGSKPDPKVCCSSGTIHHNGYVLAPGVVFFTNYAPATTQWTLRENQGYPSVHDLEKAMPYNKPPTVEAGPDIISDRSTVQLAGLITDDGQPGGARLKSKWEALEGPGSVTFQEGTPARCEAVFSTPGDYLLRLVGDDGELWTSDTVVVHVLPPGVSVAKAWEFNRTLDKEGWTEADLGTRERDERPIREQTGKSLPVKYVAGGNYIVALDSAPTARLVSADNLNVEISRHKTLRLRLQNHTAASRMVVRFTTSGDSVWDDAKSRSFAVAPNDNGFRDYVVDMSQIPGWSGALKQLRLDLTAGSSATGTCRLDYFWIDDSRTSE